MPNGAGQGQSTPNWSRKAKRGQLGLNGAKRGKTFLRMVTILGLGMVTILGLGMVIILGMVTFLEKVTVIWIVIILEMVTILIMEVSDDF